MASDFGIHHIADLGRKARRMLIAQAVLWTIAIDLTFALGLIFVGYRWQMEGLISRMTMSLTWIFGSAGIAIYFLRPTWQTRFDDTTIAEWIERRFPFFQDRLSSAVQFVRCSPSDRVVGDPTLRDAVVQEANELCRRVDPETIFDFRGLWHAVSVSLVTLLLLGLAAFAKPSLMGAGFTRLLLPWMRTPWPTEYQLVFQELPRQVVMGSQLTVCVEDRHGVLPRRVVLLVGRSGDRDRDRDVVRREMRQNGTVAEVTLANVTESLRIRAVGGDDTQMPWHEVRVINAPRLEELEVSITPPAYARQEATQANGHFQALIGSQIELRGRANRRLTNADLRVESVGAALAVFPLSIEKDGRTVALPRRTTTRWTLEASGEYYCRLTDEQGIVGDQPRWMMTAVRDRPPEISLRQPPTDAIAARNSVVSMNGIVSDDLGIRSVQLHYFTSSVDAAEMVVPLLSRSELAERELRQDIAYDWELASVADLHPGNTVTFFLVAEDFASQRVGTALQTVRIVSDDELLSWFVDREQELRGLLTGASARQTLAQTAMRELADLDTSAGPQVDGANQVRLLQADVRERITLADDAILRRMRELLRRYDESRLTASSLRRRLESTIELLQQIDVQWLVKLQYELEDIETNVTADFPERARDCQRMQQNVLDGIQEILGDMQSAAAEYDLMQELARILQSQRQMQRRTSLLRPQTLAQDTSALSPPLRAELEELTSDQGELARSAEVLFSALAQTQAEMHPMSADFRWAAQSAEQLRISAKMRQSSENVRANRLGLAHQLQADVVDHLNEIHAHLVSKRVTSDLASDAPQLERLIGRQLDLIVRTRAAYAEAQQNRLRLAREQSALADDVERPIRSSSQMVMAWAARKCAREMREASDGLRSESQADVNRLQLSALRRLRQMKQAIDSQPKSSEAGSPKFSTANPASSKAPDPLRASQLRWLWIMQDDLRHRIIEFQQESSAPFGATWQELAEEQGELADILTRIMSEPDSLGPLNEGS